MFYATGTNERYLPHSYELMPMMKLEQSNEKHPKGIYSPHSNWNRATGTTMVYCLDLDKIEDEMEVEVEVVVAAQVSSPSAFPCFYRLLLVFRDVAWRRMCLLYVCLTAD